MPVCRSRIDHGIEVYNDESCDENLYVSNCHQRTYARGFDFELFSFEMIKDAFENANEQADLEHNSLHLEE
ncbi:MAG: hypothetical protein U0X76_07695 [Bacteroidia bacterium]